MSVALMVAMGSKEHAYPQTHQIVIIKYIQFSICQSYLNSVFYKKKERKNENNNHAYSLFFFCGISKKRYGKFLALQKHSIKLSPSSSPSSCLYFQVRTPVSEQISELFVPMLLPAWKTLQ